MLPKPPKLPKLSERAKYLLWLICKSTQYDAAGKTTMVFIPQTGDYYYRDKTKPEKNEKGYRNTQTTTISGSGDASALKGLEAKGLIVRPPDCQLPPWQKYIYQSTPEGYDACKQLGLLDRFSTLD